MKAKVIATGQIIDVYISNINDSTNLPDYAEKGTSKVGLNEYSEKELDFNDVIDWEERRFIIARDIIAGLAQNSHQRIVDSSSEELARWAITTANELIKQLKNK